MLDNGADMIHQRRDSLSNNGAGTTGQSQANKTRQQQQQNEPLPRLTMSTT